MGLFFYNKIGSIISIGDLPTTNIIEPDFIRRAIFVFRRQSDSRKIILFENLLKPRQHRLAVYMLLTSSVLSTTSKQCFELTSSVLSTTSKQCFELTSSVLPTTSKQCFEQPAASFLVCSLIFIEY